MLNFLTTTTVCGFSLYHVLAFFLIYSCTGWCLEVIFAAATTGQLVNRGFLNGPVCPIYGFGMVIVLFALTPLQGSVLLLYIGGVILPSALELVGGWALYKLYHTRWWDYSDFPFNIGGYICLEFSLLWGVGTLVVMRIVHPVVAGLVDMVPPFVGFVVMCVLYAVYAADVVVTAFAASGLAKTLDAMEQLADSIHAVSDAMTQLLGTTTLNADQKLDEQRLQLKLAAAEAREAAIREGIAAIEAERPGSHVDTPARIFDEVVNLCEWPTVLVGTFDEEFLRVPQEIICESMLTNQRYFPIYDGEGKLTREFVVVSNSKPENAERVIDGNERVVRARLDDAKFFYEEDLKISLDEFRERLAKVAFQEKLGSVLAKSERIEQLALAIAREAHLGAHLAADAARAAHLCKADLVSNAVVEFTSQQGVMGGYYATAMGENDEVAHAIRDHYRPRFAGDELPEGTAGCIVACADKLDTIAGIFAIGEPPTGSSDPYALRRAAIGIINILRDRLPIDPTSLIDFALELYSEQGIEFDAAEVAQQVRDFFHGRLVSMARDEKIPADTVAAVSAVHIIAPSVFFARCAALDEARKNDAETFDNLATAYARAAHISKPELGAEYDRSLMGEVELALADASEAAQTAVDAALAVEDYPAAFAALAALRAPIDRFFDEVMVMDKDEQLRDNRLKLLNRFEAVFSGIANIGELARKK